MKTSFRRAACFAATFSILGSGCSLPTNLPGVSREPSGPKPASFEQLTPKQAAEKINFVGGSVLTMTQGVHGVGEKLAEKFGIGTIGGTRDVVIEEYAPGNHAKVSWKFTTRVTPDPKDPKDSGIRQYVGFVNGINLLSSHRLYLPGYWVEGDQHAFNASGIWLSQEVYEDLAKIRNSSLDFGLLDPAQIGLLTNLKEMTRALEALKVNLDAMGVKQDARHIVADSTHGEWPLKINGRNVTVQVLKARNWFGEIVVLDNKKNPLVLKVTLNPLLLASLGAGSGVNFLKTVGYEVTEIKEIQES